MANPPDRAKTKECTYGCFKDTDLQGTQLSRKGGRGKGTSMVWGGKGFQGIGGKDEGKVTGQSGGSKEGEKNLAHRVASSIEMGVVLGNGYLGSPKKGTGIRAKGCGQGVCVVSASVGAGSC